MENNSKKKNRKTTYIKQQQIKFKQHRNTITKAKNRQKEKK